MISAKKRSLQNAVKLGLFFVFSTYALLSLHANDPVWMQRTIQRSMKAIRLASYNVLTFDTKDDPMLR